MNLEHQFYTHVATFGLHWPFQLGLLVVHRSMGYNQGNEILQRIVSFEDLM